MAAHYRSQVEELYKALQEEADARRLKAGELVRSLVKEIILTPADGQLAIDVCGDLACILAIASKSNTPAFGTGVLLFKMVAGARNTRFLRLVQDTILRVAA